MCAIYGTTNLQYDSKELEAKLSSMKSRGPEYSGFSRIDHVILGHNRLAIIDLDARSNQPFRYKDVHIAFNGEIYNYQILKTRLEEKGYAFSTQSDTEVLCALYQEYGIECLQHINGMFAFVIYDQRKNLLFGARDRLGKKPLYYSLSNQSIEFASQIKALLTGQQYAINNAAVSDYLFWGYFPEPETIVTGIKKLRAGHYFIYKHADHSFSEHQYWSILQIQRGSFKGSYEDAKSQLTELLTDSVRIRMIADVPLGIFLSGGVDSSLILSFASKISHTPIKSFSISFQEKGYDESVHAEKIAAYFGSQQTTITCDIKEGLHYIINFASYIDEPLDDSAIIPGLLIAKNAKEHLTVALTGDGGDEAFIGYERYRWMNKVKGLFHLPPFIRRSAAAVLSRSSNYRLSTIAAGLQKDSLETLYKYMMGSMNTDWFNFTSPSLNRFPGVLTGRNGIISNISDYDILSYLNDDINVKVDRSSMAYSLETRAPLMDYRIFEFAKSIPLKYSLYKSTHKRILKDLLANEIPKSYFDRPKSGFSVPIKEWFRHELKDFVADNLTKNKLASLPMVNADKVIQMVEDHMNGKANYSRVLWRIIILLQWMQHFRAHVRHI